MNMNIDEGAEKMDVDQSPAVNRSIVGGVKEVTTDRYVAPTYPAFPAKGLGYLEWEYTMKRSAQEIFPGLLLGPYGCATRSKLGEMKAAGITHVVVARQVLERNLIRANHPEHFSYLIVEFADCATENIIPHFQTVNSFLDDCLTNGGKVLVHCCAGNSRSAALVLAYIMSKFGVTFNEALALVISKRYTIHLNEGFVSQLKEYEPIYRALHAVSLPLPGEGFTRQAMKRQLDAD
ncbi:Serine/threonine/tyrosine-interacting protein B [Orchesella cincta]|uniref:Serine/threonine/tyrosine-interacting protein B n=1 Tax=Orchesella cincta TaxID=48709 RepID=A0A1D2NAP8_ORCCI|nr:Serine/threonine/tyrosine-interacting protein B [Orchesella cincta]